MKKEIEKQNSTRRGLALSATEAKQNRSIERIERDQICFEEMYAGTTPLQEEIMKAKASGDNETEGANQEQTISDEREIIEEDDDFSHRLNQKEEVMLLIPTSPMCDQPSETMETSQCVENSEESPNAGELKEVSSHARILKEQGQDAKYKVSTEDIQQQDDSICPADPPCEEHQSATVDQMKDSVALLMDGSLDVLIKSRSSPIKNVCADIQVTVVEHVANDDDPIAHCNDNQIVGDTLSIDNGCIELPQCDSKSSELSFASHISETAELGTNSEDNQKISTQNNCASNQTSTANEEEYIDEKILHGKTLSVEKLMTEDKAQRLDNSDEYSKKKSMMSSSMVPALFETPSSNSIGSGMHSQDEEVGSSWGVDKALVENTSSDCGKPKAPHTPSRIKSQKLRPVSPLNSKMAEKIAVAISKEDKKFNDLMVSLSETKSGVVIGDESSPRLDGDLVGGAFNTLSNSTHACISPTVQLQVSKETDKSSAALSEIDLSRFPRRLESELTGAIEVQLSPRLSRNVESKSLQADAHDLLKWVDIVLAAETNHYPTGGADVSKVDICSDPLNCLKKIFDIPENINRICQHVVDCIISQTDQPNCGESSNIYSAAVSNSKSNLVDDLSTEIGVSTIESAAILLLRRSDRLQAFKVPLTSEGRFRQSIISANFTAFLKKVSNWTSVECPIQRNQFLQQMVASSFCMGKEEGNCTKAGSLREGIFGIDDEQMLVVVRFLKRSSEPFAVESSNDTPIDNSEAQDEIICEQTPSYKSNEGTYISSNEEACVTPTPAVLDKKAMECLTSKRHNKTCYSPTVIKSFKIPPPNFDRCAYKKVPTASPCPFETSVWNVPGIVLIVLGCLGDPVAVCRMKMVNKFCNRIVNENEYVMMRDSVRLGGMPNNVRPAFWMWITLQRCQRLKEEMCESLGVSDSAAKSISDSQSKFQSLEQKGKESKWHAIIVRDVARAFGNLPPHKSKGSRRNSIVRALMSWGQNHLLRRHQDGSCRVVSSPNPSGKGEPIRRLMMSRPPHKYRGAYRSNNDVDLEQSETVSDWGGISPTASNISSAASLDRTNSIDAVLSGNELTLDMKADLQKKLETILDVIAAVHEGLGYCQGM
jgi:hypothetical protein